MDKHQKKINRWKKSADDKLKDLMTEQAIQYFVLFCVIMLWDRIASMLFIRHQEGFSFMQVLGSGICLFQMIRFATKVKR